MKPKRLGGKRVRGRRALPRLTRSYLRVAMKDAGEKRAITAEGVRSMEFTVIRTAYHEAAHAVLTKHLLMEYCESITIERGSDRNKTASWGFVRRGHATLFEMASPAQVRELMRPLASKQKAELLDGAEREAMCKVAGIVVEVDRGGPDRLTLDDELVQRHSEDDPDVTTALAVLAAFERNTDRRWEWLSRLAQRAMDLLAQPEMNAALERVAEALLNTPTLKGKALERLLDAVPT